MPNKLTKVHDNFYFFLMKVLYFFPSYPNSEHSFDDKWPFLSQDTLMMPMAQSEKTRKGRTQTHNNTIIFLFENEYNGPQIAFLFAIIERYNCKTQSKLKYKES